MERRNHPPFRPRLGNFFATTGGASTAQAKTIAVRSTDGFSIAVCKTP
jgi:hypothetical protein